MENVKIIANWEKEEEQEPEPEPDPTPTEPEEKETSNEYSIKTEVIGDGEIEVVEKSMAAENIEFTIKTLNDSQLVSLEIKSNDGRNIDYAKVSEKDGTRF